MENTDYLQARVSEAITTYDKDPLSQGLEEEINFLLSKVSGQAMSSLLWRSAMIADWRGCPDKAYSLWRKAATDQPRNQFIVKKFFKSGFHLERFNEITLLGPNILAQVESRSNFDPELHAMLLDFFFKVLGTPITAMGSLDFSCIVKSILFLEDKSPGRKLFPTLVGRVLEARQSDAGLFSLYQKSVSVNIEFDCHRTPISVNTIILHLATANIGEIQDDALECFSLIAPICSIFDIERVISINEYRDLFTSNLGRFERVFAVEFCHLCVSSSHGGINQLENYMDRFGSAEAIQTAAQASGDAALRNTIVSATRGGPNSFPARLGPPLTVKRELAVCVSGQMRGYEAALLTWQSTLLLGLDYDVYVATWRRRGRRSLTPSWSDRAFPSSVASAYRSACQLYGVQVVNASYPSIVSALEGNDTVSENDIQTLYRARQVIVEDENNTSVQRLANSEKMYYKIDQAMSMVCSSGISYRYVLRIRPDKSVVSGELQSSLTEELPSGRILADAGYFFHWWTGFAMGDQVAVGNAEDMVRYSSVWRNRSFCASPLTGFEQRLTGHRALAYTNILSGLSVSTLPIRWGPLLDPSALDLETVRRLVVKDATGRSSQMDRTMLSACDGDR